MADWFLKVERCPRSGDQRYGREALPPGAALTASHAAYVLCTAEDSDWGCSDEAQQLRAGVRAAVDALCGALPMVPASPPPQRMWRCTPRANSHPASQVSDAIPCIATFLTPPPQWVRFTCVLGEEGWAAAGPREAPRRSPAGG